MSSVMLTINGKWLKWARETAYYNLNDVAFEINESSQTIEIWENTGNISSKNLEKLAELYRRPTTIFFNNDNPRYSKDIPDFRTFGSKKPRITPKIAFELRRARSKRETLLNLKGELNDYDFPLFDFDDFQSDDIEEIIEFINGIFGINRAKIKRNLDYWINKAESLGILVFKFYEIPIEELRGYALYEEELPIIGINNRENDKSSKFTFFHELTHLFLKKEGISNINEYNLINYDEILCNKIASELLIQSDVFRNYINENPSFRNFSIEDIKKLSNIFKVSKQVIVRKALDLNFISKEEYNHRIDEFNSYINPTVKKHIYKRKTKDENEVDHYKGLHQKAVRALNENGRYFTKLLFEAYGEDIISSDDLALELNISLEVIPELSDLLKGEE